MPTAAAASVGDEPEAELSAEEPLTTVDGETNVYSGTCGPDVTWIFDTETGELIISGLGEMTESPRVYVNSQLIQTVTINEGVTSIVRDAFDGCASLETVTIADSVTYIGDTAFASCSSLKSIHLPEKLTTVSDQLFNHCTALTSITVPDSVVSIGDLAFYECSSLEEIYIGKSVEKINGRAFIGCTALKNIIVASGNQNFCDEDGVLFDYQRTALLNYPAGKQSSWYSIPSGVTIIGENAFSSCESLIRVTIPDGLKSIGASAFRKCTNLTRVVVPDGVQVMDVGAFSGCSSLKNVSIPDSIEELGNDVFVECYSLEYISIPNGLTAISAGTFYGCTKLQSIEIPISIKNVGLRAFYGCNSLADVYYAGSEEDWKEISFTHPEYNTFNATIHYNSAGSEPSACIIYSSGDDGIDRYFKFRENEEVEDLVLATSSTSYNPRLAHMLCVMARAAYDQPLVRSNLEEMGFFIENELISGTDYYEDYADDTTVAFSLAKKTLADGSTFVMITIRGTFNWSVTGDGIRNADIGIAALNGFGKHEGFQIDAENIYNALSDFLGGIPTSDITYVITGHSQGAAAGNLLAVMLYDNGVPSSCVYDYNFACPNVACLLNPNDWNPSGAHNNIFNIGNVEDPVTYLPSNLVKMFIPRLSPLSTWGKFGRSYWFYPDVLNHNVAGHDMIYYDNELSAENPLSSFVEYGQIAGERILRVIGVHCPVDVIVYDASGTPIAGVIDNEACYYDSSFGEVMIFVDGDEKWIYIPNDQDYEIRLSATDEGEMQYEVYDVNFTNEEVINEKTFESVALTDGKEMSSTVGGAITTDDIRLVSMGENGMPITMIQTDGIETTFGDVDGNETINAFDAALILRHVVGLTDEAAGYTTEDAAAVLYKASPAF